MIILKNTSFPLAIFGLRFCFRFYWNNHLVCLIWFYQKSTVFVHNKHLKIYIPELIPEHIFHYVRNPVTLCRSDHVSGDQWTLGKLEIVDQWSTRIPPPHRRRWQWAMGGLQLSIVQITRQPFWKRHSWQSLGFCLQPQKTCIWNLKLKFQSKQELRCRNHATQKPKNLIWPPGSHLENEVTENQ